MKNIIFLFFLTFCLCGCMEHTQSHLNHVFRETARDAGENVGGR